MEIKILGPGCKKCAQTAKIVSAVVDEMKVAATVTKVTDMMEIARHGVMNTPAVVLDGEVIASGKVPDKKQVRKWLEHAG